MPIVSSLAPSLASGRRQRSLASLAAAAALVLAGCASTTQLDSQWSDPQFAGTSLRGARVMAVCEAAEQALKRHCEDQLAAQLTAYGATVLPAPAVVPDSAARQSSAEPYLAAARAAGAKAVLVANVAPAAAVARPGPSIGVGIGGFGGGYRSGVGGGVGISLPVGAGKVDTGYAADTALTDVASRRLMWAGKASAAPSSDLNAQVAELAKAVLAGAAKAGFF
jgi:hypothetical protein